MSTYIEYVETEWLRKVIRGKTTFRKCPACDKDGLEYWDETGNSVLPYPHPDWGNDFCSGPCENCGGLAYIENSGA